MQESTTLFDHEAEEGRFTPYASTHLNAPPASTEQPLPLVSNVAVATACPEPEVPDGKRRVPFMSECHAGDMSPVESPTQPHVEARNRGELAASEEELHRLAPEADEGVIEGLVQSAYDELMPVKVHNYVPILIVHQVRDILRSRESA